MKDHIIEIEVELQPIDEFLIEIDNHISLTISDLETETTTEESKLEDVEIEMESLNEDANEYDDNEETSPLEDLELDFGEIFE